MYIERIRVVRLGPFDDLAFDLLERDGSPRLMTVVSGDGGTGKTTLMTSLAHTRPGKIVPPTAGQRRGDGESYVICDWRLGAEDPERPHTLRLASPHVKFGNAEAEQLRRREQTHFDRQAVEGPGYAFVEIPGQRYFARATVGLNDPARTMMRYDVRAAAASSDASRPDLTRPCKQALAYAAISAALTGDRKGQQRDTRFLGTAMNDAVTAVSELGGYGYRGIEPQSFEPLFESPGGSPVLFDGLPTQVKHLIAFVALPIRTFWAAHRGKDPRESEGVVVIDDFELHLGPTVYAALLPVLSRALPKAQWILTTSSPFAAAACDAEALVTLRRGHESDIVTLYADELALTH